MYYDQDKSNASQTTIINFHQADNIIVLNQNVPVTDNQSHYGMVGYITDGFMNSSGPTGSLRATSGTRPDVLRLGKPHT
jgi:hypothetical protein